MMFQNLDEVVKGSIGEVNRKLHEVGDFSKSSRELSIMVVALKKELEAQSKEKFHQRKELNGAFNLRMKLKADIDCLSKKINEMSKVST